MRFVREPARYLLIAALALPAGCGGCTATIESPDWDDWSQELVGQLYLQIVGPAVLTGSVGAAAPPGGGGLSAIATELAWRIRFEQEEWQPRDPEAVASAIGTAAQPGGSGGLSALCALVGQDARREQRGKSRHAPSLFEAVQPHEPKTVSREIVLVR
jgi:hypothetical protein